MKKFVLGSFWLLQTLHGKIILRILIIFFFDFLATLLFAKIAQSHLHYLITSLVLKTSVRPFYFIFGLWIFCKSCLGLQQLPNGMQHEHIQKKIFQPYGIQASKFVIFVFLQQLKLHVPPLWLHVFFSLLRIQLQKLNIYQQCSFNLENFRSH